MLAESRTRKEICTGKSATIHRFSGLPTNQVSPCARFKMAELARRNEAQSMTRDEAWNLANHWVEAWNSHDLDMIMTHYEDAVELTSPAAAQLFGTSDGKVVGKANLRAYFQRGLEAYPELRFRLEDVLGRQQRDPLLHQSKGNPHRRVHGAFRDRKSGARGCELQRMKNRRERSCTTVAGSHPEGAGDKFLPCAKASFQDILPDIIRRRAPCDPDIAKTSNPELSQPT